ncbi:MAG: hypothetical protein RL581_30 [Actinomycetota bacterium]
MAAAKSDYGFRHGLRKFLLNIKYLLKYQPNSKKHPDSKLVLVISFPRSGTHALASMIDHPGIGLNYYGEFFIFNQWSPIVEDLNKSIPFFSWRYFLNTRRQKRNWEHYRFEKTSLDPIKTIEKILIYPGTHTIKIFPEHLSMETLTKIISKFKPHIVILRRNHLDRYISLKKANATGKWHKVNSSDVEITINDSELQRYVDQYIDWYGKVKRAAFASDCQVMDIEFGQLHDAATTQSIQKFVAVNSHGLDSLPKAPTTTKMDQSSRIQEEYLALHNKKHSDFDFASIK